MNSFHHLIATALFVVLIAVFGTRANAQEPVNDLARSVVDLKQRLEADTSIAETAKTEILAQIQLAEANLNKIDELKKRMATDQEAAATAVARSASDLEKLQSIKNSKPPSPEPTAQLPEIENKVTSLKDKLKQLDDALKQNELEGVRRSARRLELRPLLDGAEERMEETQTKIKALSSEDNSLAAQTARIVLMTASELAEMEKSSFAAELKRYDVGDQEKTLRNQRDLLTEQLAQTQTQLAEFEKRQSELRQLERKIKSQEAEKIELEKGRTNPLLASSYEINTSLAKRAEAVEKRALDAKRELDKINEQVVDIQRLSQDTKKRIETIGLTESIGALLRQRKSKLPSISKSLANAEAIKAEMNDVQYEMFDIDQRRDDLSQAYIWKEIESANGPQPDAVLQDLGEPIEELIASRKEKLGALHTSLENLFVERLSEIEYKDRILINETTKFREYINERILWIRSNDLLFSKLEIDSPDENALKISSWKMALDHGWKTITRSPIRFWLSLVLILLLTLLKPKLRREVDRFGQIASRGSCDTIWPTIKALILTTLIAITVPLFPLLLGLILLTGNEGSDSALYSAFGPTLLAVAWFIIPFEILGRFCRPNGLANEHFDWSDRSVEILRHNVRRIIIPGAIAVFLVAFLRNLDQVHGVDNIERTLFVIAMIGFAYFAWQTFSPNHGIFAEYLKDHERSWVNQTAVLWFGMIVGLPISLAILAILGYYYTAVQLADRAFMTFVFAVSVETIRELFKRMILVRRRNVHIKAARRKHELQLQARREQQKTASPSDVNASTAAEFVPETNDIQLDIDENAKQANKLVSLSMIVVWAVGLWVIWADVLPALKALDNYTVWPANGEIISQLADGETTSSTTISTPMTPATETSAATAAATSPASKRITVRNLLIFLVILIVTLLSARSLPSALEMLLLEQLPFDRSLRYAIKSLTSYAIVLVGMILAFRALSIGWNNVQWLATALTFGLAFGLQEIFANFVAGIILMFERPMRIGDWITVDDFTGVVTKIRTRATTIVNWDRKEYVIPNKDFITGRLVNWTLSDAINRIIVTVGVAYGSDVEKAKQILMEICDQHPKIVEDPPPTVAFELFADSSLNLTIRAFLGEIECRLKVIDELHTSINQAFNDAGIVIAFPQRDVHVYSASASPVDLIPDSPTSRQPKK